MENDSYFLRKKSLHLTYIYIYVLLYYVFIKKIVIHMVIQNSAMTFDVSLLTHDI